MMVRTYPIAVAAAAALCCGGAAAQATGDYATDLSRVYEAPQLIQAVKEACDTGHAASRAANEAAYNAWRRRHRALLHELEVRFTAMVRGASTDEQDYARNMGKYAGAVVGYREELKQQILARPPQELERHCREFPQYLRGEDGDLPRRYAEELKVIRQRKL
jgi:hypothetical protein